MLRMYTLCLAGIIGLGLGTAGCSGSSHPPAGKFELHWTAGATCPAAGATDIYLYLVDVRDNYGYQEHFACPAYQGTSEPLPPDDYTASVQVTDASGTLLDELSFPDVYPIYAGSVTRLPDVDLLAQPTVVQPTTGTFAVRWSLALTTGGAATCSGAGAATVDLDLLDTAGNSYHDTFTCSDYQDTSEALPPGDYTVAVRAYDANDVLVSEWVSSPSAYRINAGSVTQLPDVVLQVQ